MTGLRKRKRRSATSIKKQERRHKNEKNSYYHRSVLRTGEGDGLRTGRSFRPDRRDLGDRQKERTAGRSGRSDNGKIRKFPMDITDKSSWKILKKALEEEKPDVKFLINAAGYGKLGHSQEISLEDETGMIGLNCMAPDRSDPYRPSIYVQAQPHPPVCLRSRFPSPAWFCGVCGYKILCAQLLHGFKRGAESRDIVVTAVCPGPVNTEFFDIAETTGKTPFYKKDLYGRSEKSRKKGCDRQRRGKNRIHIRHTYESVFSCCAGRFLTG